MKESGKEAELKKKMDGRIESGPGGIVCSSSSGFMPRRDGQASRLVTLSKKRKRIFPYMEDMGDSKGNIVMMVTDGASIPNPREWRLVANAWSISMSGRNREPFLHYAPRNLA